MGTGCSGVSSATAGRLRCPDVQPPEKLKHAWPARLRTRGRERRAHGAQLLGPGRRGGAQAARQREEGRGCRLPRHTLHRGRAARGAC